MHLDPPVGPAWEFLLLFAVIVAAPRLIEKVGLPGIVGLLLGGFAIGPHGLALITADQATVPELGQLGLLYLMFLAGLELDLAQLAAYRRSAVVFGLVTFAVPMALGVGVGLMLGWAWPAVLLLGSLLASHTLVTYGLVKERGLAADPAVATAVGATVLTDTLALIVLAGVSGAQQGSGTPVEIGLQLVLGMAVLVVGTLLVLPRLVRWAFRRLGSAQPTRYVLLIAAFLAAAVLAEVFGIEGIVGAFFAGLALNRLVPNGSRLMSRVEFFGTALLVPVFIVSIGFVLDPSVLVQPATLSLAGILIVACVGGKALAAWAGRLLGFSGPQAGLLFALTAPQAAATLAATTVGLQLGLFQTAVVNAVLVLILVSLIVSPIAVRISAPRVPRASGTAPLGSRVLVAVPAGCPEPQVRALLRIGVLVARSDGGTVEPVLVRHAPHAEADPDAPDELVRLQELAVRAGIDSDAAVVVDRSLAHGTVHTAAARRASLVVVPDGVHADGGRSDRHWAEAVAAVAPAPVVLVRGGGRVRDVVLLDDDALPDGTRLLAAELARRLGAGDVRTTRGDGPTAPAGSADGRDPRATVLAVPLGGGVADGVAVRPTADWTLPDGMPGADDALVLLVPPPAIDPSGALPHTDPAAALAALRHGRGGGSRRRSVGRAR